MLLGEFGRVFDPGFGAKLSEAKLDSSSDIRNSYRLPVSRGRCNFDGAAHQLRGVGAPGWINYPDRTMVLAYGRNNLPAQALPTRLGVGHSKGIDQGREGKEL
jgi:hypothetical protein